MRPRYRIPNLHLVHNGKPTHTRRAKNRDFKGVQLRNWLEQAQLSVAILECRADPQWSTPKQARFHQLQLRFRMLYITACHYCTIIEETKMGGRRISAFVQIERLLDLLSRLQQRMREELEQEEPAHVEDQDLLSWRV